MVVGEDKHLKNILSKIELLSFESKSVLEDDLIFALGDTSLCVMNYDELMTRLDWEDVLSGSTFKLRLSYNLHSYNYYFKILSKLDEPFVKVCFKGLHKIL